MTDLTKSKVLRVILFAITMAFVLFATSVVDYIHDFALGGIIPTPSHVVECVVYIWVCSRIIWGWLSRRVWVGTERS